MPKTTTRVKGAHKESSRKKASPKTPHSSIKSKKSRRAALHGHYPKVNEAPHQNENEPKTIAKAKRPLHGSSRKKASRRSPRPSIKSKRSRGPILYGHYHRLHEALKRYENESEEDQESMQKPMTSNSYWGS